MQETSYTVINQGGTMSSHKPLYERVSGSVKLVTLPRKDGTMQVLNSIIQIVKLRLESQGARIPTSNHHLMFEVRHASDNQNTEFLVLYRWYKMTWGNTDVPAVLFGPLSIGFPDIVGKIQQLSWLHSRRKIFTPQQTAEVWQYIDCMIHTLVIELRISARYARPHTV